MVCVCVRACMCVCACMLRTLPTCAHPFIREGAAESSKQSQEASSYHDNSDNEGTTVIHVSLYI